SPRGAGPGTGVGSGGDLPHRPGSVDRAMAGSRPGGGVVAESDVPVPHMGVLSSGRARHRPPAIRILGSPSQEVGVALGRRHPGKAFSVATRNDRLKYYRMMFSPVAFLPLAAPGTLLLALPMLAINALSSFPYQREIIYHYAALVLAGIMLATVEAVAFLGRTRRLRRLLVGLLLATSLATTVAWGPSPISTRYHNPLWPLEHDPRLPAYQAAVRTA